MDLEDFVHNLSEISHRKKNTIGFHSYAESKEQNKQSRNRLIGSENIWQLSEKRGVRGMGEKGEGIKKYKLLL